MMNRRKFVAAMAVAGGGAKAAPRLAVDGGQPVRAKPLRAEHWGPSYFDDKERAAVTVVVDAGHPFRWTSRGRKPPGKVAAFEKELAARIQTRFALAVSCGTAALQTAMAALQIGPGDEVILPAWTWHSTCTAVIMAGALPVFAEIDESFNLDPADVEHRITPQTKLVIPVHLQGNPAEMAPVLEIARKHGLKVLEDSAQAVGGSYQGRPLGSLGDMGIYSHQLSKTITAGEGGSLVTSDPVLFERAARFHDVGGMRTPHQQWVGGAVLDPFTGVNFRMNEFTGGVMLEQLRKLDTILAAARRMRGEFTTAFSISRESVSGSCRTPTVSSALACSSSSTARTAAAASSTRWPPRTCRPAGPAVRSSSRCSHTSRRKGPPTRTGRPGPLGAAPRFATARRAALARSTSSAVSPEC
jgi:8-amino-3,8-dideoxy-alpha-D-manno-octulosonate transaminase